MSWAWIAWLTPSSDLQLVLNLEFSFSTGFHNGVEETNYYLSKAGEKIVGFKPLKVQSDLLFMQNRMENRWIHTFLKRIIFIWLPTVSFYNWKPSTNWNSFLAMIKMPGPISLPLLGHLKHWAINSALLSRYCLERRYPVSKLILFSHSPGRIALTQGTLWNTNSSVYS